MSSIPRTVSTQADDTVGTPEVHPGDTLGNPAAQAPELPPDGAAVQSTEVTKTPEQIVAEAEGAQPTEIPEKFRNPDGTPNVDAMVKAHAELERAFHEKAAAPPAETETPPAAEGGAEGTAGWTKVDEKMTAWETEFAQSEGKLKPETMAEITKELGVPEQFVQAYLEGQMALSVQRGNEVKSIVGGPEAYDSLIGWIAQTDGRDKAEAFIGTLSKAMQAGDDAALQQMLGGAKARMDQAKGKRWAPEITGVTPGGDAIKPFESRAEMASWQRMDEYRNGDESFHKTFDLRLAKSKQMGIF